MGKVKVVVMIRDGNVQEVISDSKDVDVLVLDQKRVIFTEDVVRPKEYMVFKDAVGESINAIPNTRITVFPPEAERFWKQYLSQRFGKKNVGRR
ncbi:MAG: hypothetical protein HQK96_01560 [Nitrospirae bacterium]|nr:hypothetical protein [Nitrospirota bacterium]